MKIALYILLSALTGVSSLHAAAVQARPVTVQRISYTFAPQAGQLVKPDGARLQRSLIWADSKSQAFHLDRSHIVKFYTGPRYEAEGRMTPAEVERMGRREVELLSQWAREGSALPVVETGTTEEGTFYAVLEKPKRGVSGGHLVKKGRVKEVQDRLERLAKSLSDNLWRLGTFNPTQVYVERTGQRRALLIKAYSYDDKGQDPKALESYYGEKLKLFEALAQMYPELRSGKTLSDGERTTEKSAIARMLLEAVRTKAVVRIVYQRSAREQAKAFHIQPLRSSLKNNDFMKGYIRALVFPEGAGSGKEYSFRLDRVQEAEFLHRRQPAGGAALAKPEMLGDEDIYPVALAATVDKGRPRWKARVRRAAKFLSEQGASEKQLALFREYVEKASPAEGEAAKRGALTDEVVLQAAHGAISYKGRPWSETEYNSVLYPKAWWLADQGASFRQMILFFKTCREAPIRGGSFNRYSGD